MRIREDRRMQLIDGRFIYSASDLNNVLRLDLTQDRLRFNVVFLQTPFDQRKRERGSVNGNTKLLEEKSNCADVIFMPVRQDNRANVPAILFQIRNVGDNQVNAEQFGFWKHHARVNDDDVVAQTQDHHVHAELAETTEGDCREGLRGLAQ